MRRVTFLALVLVTPAATLAAQSSQFAARGLGLPGRGLSASAVGTGGAFGLFDPTSTTSEAALTTLTRISLGLESIQEWRSVENPAGSGSVRNNRFPQFRLAGPVKDLGVWLGASVSSYTNQDFGAASSATVLIRGEPVPFADTTTSIGGLSDLRLAAGTELGTRWAVGGAVHIITGSARNAIHRTSLDTLYGSFRDSSEFSFSGWGISLSVLGRLSNTLAVAAAVRADRSASVSIDSADAGHIDLPHRLALGLLWQPADRLRLAAQGALETWSAANSDLLERGGNGSRNVYRLSLGGTYNLHKDRPDAFPLRFGGFYGSLPFSLRPGELGTELGLSLGTGTRFAQDRAAVDIALERLWRSETDAWSESAWNLWIGMTVRP